MLEKDNINDSLIPKSEEKNKPLLISKPFFKEEDSNTESIKNSVLSEYDSEFKSDKDANSSRTNFNNININYPNKSYSHKTINTIIGLKFKKSKNYDEEVKSRESYSITYKKVLNFSKTHYILYICNLLSFSINYESIWRFPYYFILSEGAVFFIPFFIFYFLFGIPILTLESSFGQIFKSGPDVLLELKIGKEKNHFFSLMALKILILSISFIITIYFGSILAQCIHYFLLCFSYDLPWAFQLGVDRLYNLPFYKSKFVNHDSSRQNFDIIRLGDINYHRVISTFIVWFIFYLLLSFKMDITKHKFIYRFLCFGPIIIIFLIFISCIHPRIGFFQGCVYFLIPKMEKLLNYKPWLLGINQAIFLLMLGNGKNLLFSSNIKENDNVYSRSTLTSLLVLFSGIFCTFYSCIYAGLIAEELNLDNINDIPFNNSNLPFVAYLLSLGMMKHNRLFSIIFLLSLIIIGFQTLYLSVNNLSFLIHKKFDKYLNYYTASLILCLTSFILCIPFTRNQGQFFLEWIDKYVSLLPLIFIVLYEILLINDKIGINLLLEIISNKTGIVLPLYIFYFTKYITPIILIIMIAFAFVYQYYNKQNSIITTLLEWIILLSPFFLFIFFLIKEWNNKTFSNFKKLENNILRDELFRNFPKIKNKRKMTEMPINIENKNNNYIKKLRSASFTNKARNNDILSEEDDYISDAIESEYIHQNDDLMGSIDCNSISLSDNNTRKQTLEMEYIHKQDKDS